MSIVQQNDDRLFAKNKERFAVEHDQVRNLSQVIDRGSPTKSTATPLTDWMVHEAAIVMRYGYQMGQLP